jgi:hypothetical protein
VEKELEAFTNRHRCLDENKSGEQQIRRAFVAYRIGRVSRIERRTKNVERQSGQQVKLGDQRHEYICDITTLWISNFRQNPSAGTTVVLLISQTERIPRPPLRLARRTAGHSYLVSTPVDEDACNSLGTKLAVSKTYVRISGKNPRCPFVKERQFS